MRHCLGASYVLHGGLLDRGIARSPAGRFGFVELRTEELAQAAMQLDKVELCGRSINVGRPKGYVEPPPGARPVAALGAAQVPCQAVCDLLGRTPTVNITEV